MTKNKDIHNGLEKKEIRDFLSESLLNNIRLELANKKEVIRAIDGEYSLVWHLKEAQANIDFWKIKIQVLQDRLSILSLIKQNEWEEHDVSDETILESNDHYMSFIGTKDEYETFIKNNPRRE